MCVTTIILQQFKIKIWPFIGDLSLTCAFSFFILFFMFLFISLLLISAHPRFTKHQNKKNNMWDVCEETVPNGRKSFVHTRINIASYLFSIPPKRETSMMYLEQICIKTDVIVPFKIRPIKILLNNFLSWSKSKAKKQKN